MTEKHHEIFERIYAAVLFFGVLAIAAGAEGIAELVLGALHL